MTSVGSTGSGSAARALVERALVELVDHESIALYHPQTLHSFGEVRMTLRIALDFLAFDLEQLTYSVITGLASLISSRDAGYVLRRLSELAVPILVVVAVVLLALAVIGALRKRGRE